MSRRDLDRIDAAARATVTLLMLAAMILGFMLALAKAAGATALDCAVTTECSSVYTEHATEGTIEHEQWVSGSASLPDPAEIEDGNLQFARKKRHHCTAAEEYDSLLAGVLAGNGQGYYLDADGSTLWSAKRERVTRCRPANMAKFDHLKDMHHSLSLGHWLRWSESWSTIDRRWEVICRTVIGGTPAPVPEPSTVLLLGSGMLGLAWVARGGRR